LTRAVESSMMKLTGTLFLGFKTVISDAILLANKGLEIPAEINAEDAIPFRMKSRRELLFGFICLKFFDSLRFKKFEGIQELT
jgi:hypothetical protein